MLEAVFTTHIGEEMNDVAAVVVALRRLPLHATGS